MANLSEVLLRKRGHGTLHTGVAPVDEDLASIHKLTAASSKGPNSSGSQDSGAVIPCGVPERSITELSGLSGSGKTTMALALMIDTIRRGLDVLYVGCDYRSFPWERIRRTQGWKSDRFDSRIHTVYVKSIEQLLTIRPPENTALVVIEHYDTLIKRTWPVDLRQRAANACTWKFNTFSKNSCVFVTSGCVKTELHDSIVPGPAVKLWNKSSNMERILIYKDAQLNYVLSTGGYFQIDAQGMMVSAQDKERKPTLSLPGLSSKKHSYPPRTPKTATPHGLPTPASKRSKLYLSVTDGSCHEQSHSSSEPPSSPFDHKNKHSLLPEQSLIRPSTPALSPSSPRSSQLSTQASQPSTQPSLQPCQQIPQMQDPAVRWNDAVQASHMDTPLPQFASGREPSDPKVNDIKPNHVNPTRGDSFLGLEIVPNSQVDIDDPEYSLQPSMS